MTKTKNTYLFKFTKKAQPGCLKEGNISKITEVTAMRSLPMVMVQSAVSTDRNRRFSGTIPSLPPIKLPVIMAPILSMMV